MKHMNQAITIFVIVILCTIAGNQVPEPSVITLIIGCGIAAVYIVVQTIPKTKE